jgi:hypothetical protein
MEVGMTGSRLQGELFKFGLQLSIVKIFFILEAIGGARLRR